MNKRILVAAGLLIAGLAIGFAVGQLGGGGTARPGGESGEREILYWAAPMDPGYRSDKPGKSPMGMELVPVYAGEEPGAAENAIRISPAVMNNLGVRTAPVERGPLSREIDTVGFIAPDDDLTTHLHTRIDGWVEKLLVKTEGDRVARGDLLLQLYSPTLVNAQTEYLQALRIGQTSLTAAARERLTALGMSADQIDELRNSRTVKELVDIRAPQDGIVTSLQIGEGMFIQPGTTILTLADLSSIWTLVEVYEDQAAWVDAGQRAAMRLAFVPGRTWEGTVDYVYPTVDPVSRTVRLRLKFPNPGEYLKPNMYSEVELYGTPKEAVLHIPREALIRAGESERVILALGGGRFRAAQVTSGMEAGKRVEILAGLREGEMVVTSGQFLLDSEASLNPSFLRMESEVAIEDMPTPPAETGGDHSEMDMPTPERGQP